MKDNYRSIVAIIFLFTLLNSLGGCANSREYREERTIAKTSSIRINGIKYIPLKLICQTYEIDWQWNPVSKEIILQKNGSEIELRVGSSIALINGKIRKIMK